MDIDKNILAELRSQQKSMKAELRSGMPYTEDEALEMLEKTSDNVLDEARRTKLVHAISEYIFALQESAKTMEYYGASRHAKSLLDIQKEVSDAYMDITRAIDTIVWTGRHAKNIFKQ